MGLVKSPEDVFVVAGCEGVGQLVTEKAEVVEAEGCPYLGPCIPHHPAEHIYKVTLVPHLQKISSRFYLLNQRLPKQCSKITFNELPLTYHCILDLWWVMALR